MNLPADAPREGVTYVATFFNKRRFIPLVIEALKRQRGDFRREFVFVDDGSTDGSLDLLLEASRDMRDVLVVTQANAGPTWALNRGLDLVRTRLTKGLDGDDILMPDATQQLLAALDACEGCRWAFGASRTYDAIPGCVDEVYPADVAGRAESRKIGDQLLASLRMPQANPSAWLAETALLREVGNCDEAIFIQDYSIELRMAAAGPAAVSSAIIHRSHSVIQEGRVMWNERQMLHDANLAVLNLFLRLPRLLDRYGWVAAERLTGRAWHWAKRREAKSPWSREYLAFVLSRLRLGDPLRFMRASCLAFGSPIIRPGAASPPRTVHASGVFA